VAPVQEEPRAQMLQGFENEELGFLHLLQRVRKARTMRRPADADVGAGFVTLSTLGRFTREKVPASSRWSVPSKRRRFSRRPGGGGFDHQSSMPDR